MADKQKQADEKYCSSCGEIIKKEAEVCPKCGVRQKSSVAPAGKQPKSWTVAILLSFFVGTLGIDRFYLGYIGLGILKLITFGGCGIWWLVDLILIAMNKLKDSDGNELEK